MLEVGRGKDEGQVLIIIEGVDGVGKSYLAGKLVELTDARLLHAKQPEGDAYQEYVEPLEEYAPTSLEDDPRQSPKHRHVVCDRWHLGELVYGPLYRDGAIFRPGELSLVEAFLNAQGAVIVYMTEDKDVVMKRWKERGEDFLKLGDYDFACVEYEHVMMASTVPVLRVTGAVTRPVVARIINVGLAFAAAQADARRKVLT